MFTPFKSPRTARILLSFLVLWSLSLGTVLVGDAASGFSPGRVATIGIRN